LNFFLKIFKLLPPEIAHSASLISLKILHKTKLLKFFIKKNSKNENYKFAGMIFSNKLGTAAGLDKNGDFIDALGELGFGFLEVGTITPLPQSGNAKPRVFRNYKEESIINSLGFNNKGVDYLVENLKRRKFKGVVGVNIGANKSSSGNQRVDDYLICLEKVHKYADYITVNISSPNTPNLRDLHNEKNFKSLISALEERSKKIGINIPIFIKISPDESNDALDSIINIVKESFLSGIVATNTTINKANLVDQKFKSINGGLSGKYLKESSTKKISYIKGKHKDISLIGVGGVMSKNDYLQKIEAGASLVQIYTGFIIKGPKLIDDILRD
tara:strand:+ start:623 stop:1612 length:990 start_codon:yes stop_codon:yes gene_type:complete